MTHRPAIPARPQSAAGPASAEGSATATPRLSRRTALTGGLAATAAVAAGWRSTPVARADDDLPSHLVRAGQAYSALQDHLYDPETGLYREHTPQTDGNPWSYVWPFSQAVVGTQVLAGIPGVGRQYASAVSSRFDALEAYWNSETTPTGYDSYLRPPLGQGGDKFYDDNEWIALSFLLRHNMSPHGDSVALRRAAEIFDLIVFGWDDDSSHPCPGGVFWTQASWSNDRNTVSNAPGAEVGLRLYLETGQQSYLDWSLKMYEWTRSYMLAPNGLYWDHVNLAGVIEKTQWSYNQGVMIGAGALLYRATRDDRYLQQAKDTAAAALAFYAEDERYFSQPAEFHAIFFANLLQLSVIAPDPRYRQALAWYADEAYRRYRAPDSGLYTFEEPVPLLHQAAMVRIEGMLAWKQQDYSRLT
ncbi:glycoside hydrolase family 76 protein [Microlunatus soli]|uniref:Glycosyl hydrolase family 76 n=1 Tax=Microlunatus soli TaxID=630515 RepID=A0A1H1RFJ0_9ACTN|nr:glycoside hydrolase family 76 protein [Microlunatus soli]SDS34452.1 Glycosyl hydrolase family 76 [Microlunatus soli]